MSVSADVIMIVGVGVTMSAPDGEHAPTASLRAALDCGENTGVEDRAVGLNSEYWDM